VKIFPFRGVRYDAAKVGDLSAVVTQPYDKIDDELMRKYYAKSPYNFTRVIKAEAEPHEPYNNRYTRAREYIKKWLGEGVFARDQNPAVYVYHQKFKYNGKPLTRKGFIALVETQRFGEGVKAHEKTLEGPKADRLNLMRATFANTEQIFMLYSDPTFRVSSALDTAIAGREPDARAIDDFGEENLLWVVSNPEVHRVVTDGMADKQLFVADGHHRYETACNFFEEKALEGYVCDGSENIRNVMLTMVNMDEPGLVIYPTHRLIFGVKDFDPVAFLTKARMHFDLTTYRFADEGEDAARRRLFEAMDARAETATVFGFYAHGEDAFHLMEFNDPKMMTRMVGKEFSKDYKKLDIAILHAVLKKFFKIGDEALKAETNVNYVRGREEAIKRVNEVEKYQCTFLVNPTKIDDVKKVAMAGERMPQKSTDFYPKLLSGLVFNKMNCQKGE